MISVRWWLAPLFCGFVGCAPSATSGDSSVDAAAVDAVAEDVSPQLQFQRNLERGTWSRMHPTLNAIYRYEFRGGRVSRVRDWMLSPCLERMSYEGMYTLLDNLLTVRFETGTIERTGCRTEQENQPLTPLPAEAITMANHTATLRIVGDTLTLTRDGMDEIYTR